MFAKLHGSKRLFSWSQIILSQPVSQARVEPGKENTIVLLANPPKTLD
tara:strand:+ start:874 stop:1017 length:144 start_codon:yes stop_codon:yes gene_type:complete